MPVNTKPDDELDEPSITEQLADDAAVQELEYPEGVPALLVLLALPRRRRSAYFRALAVVADHQAKSAKHKVVTDPSKDKRPVELKLAHAADQADLVAAVEDLLATVAVDEETYRKWALEATDADLVKTYNVWMKKTQPGEASSSSS